MLFYFENNVLNTDQIKCVVQYGEDIKVFFITGTMETLVIPKVTVKEFYEELYNEQRFQASIGSI